MTMYMCHVCGKGVMSGDKHECKPQIYPFNVLSDKKESAEKLFKSVTFKEKE